MNIDFGTKSVYIVTRWCYVCQKDTEHLNGKCGECLSRKTKEARQTHFKRLDGMDVEQRLRELEKAVYFLTQEHSHSDIFNFLDEHD